MSKYTVGQTVFVTRWALGSGIQKAMVAEHAETTRCRLSGLYGGFTPNEDVFGDIEDAQRDVRARAEAKLESLEKQAAKLRKIIDNGARVKDVGK